MAYEEREKIEKRIRRKKVGTSVNNQRTRQDNSFNQLTLNVTTTLIYKAIDNLPCTSQKYFYRSLQLPGLSDLYISALI